MVRKSIRWRIQIWYGALLICLVAGLMLGFYSYERSARFREIDAQLRDLTTPLLPRIDRRLNRDFDRPEGNPDDAFGPPPDGPPPRARGRGSEGLRPDEQGGPDGPGRGPRGRRSDGPNGPAGDEAPGGQEGEGSQPAGADPVAAALGNQFYYQVWSAEGAVLHKSRTAPEGLVAPTPRDYSTRMASRTRGGFREFVQFVPNDDVLVVGVPIAAANRSLEALAAEMCVIGGLIVAAGLLGGWWVAGRALRPIAVISTAAEEIAGGDLSRRINVAETESELGQLAGILNRSFERLEKTFDQQVQFNAATSKELHTPIAVILSQIQTALSREPSPDAYRDTMATCEYAAKRMRVLVNSLLELARVDSGEFQLLREECDLADVAREALDFVAPLAKQRKVALRPAIASIKMRADVMKLSQVLINLLTNAVQHNREGIVVSLTVERQGGDAVLRVVDNGSAIPADALPRLFDRFYGEDKPRPGSPGGTGLGLAICKTVVEAHGGTIRAERAEIGAGSVFTLRLPLESGEGGKLENQLEPAAMPA